jgi:hypothetical protein
MSSALWPLTIEGWPYNGSEERLNAHGARQADPYVVETSVQAGHPSLTGG